MHSDPLSKSDPLIDQEPPATTNRATGRSIREALNGRAIVIIGMMGAGKSSIGKRLAQSLDMDFVDSDDEIEKAANLTIPEIFERHGESYFRDGEHRVIRRLLGEGDRVVSIGGGAFENATTRDVIAEAGVSIWLKADFATLMARVRRKSHRPLLKTKDPEETLRKLMEQRDPNYAKADIVVRSTNEAHSEVVTACIGALAQRLKQATGSK